MADNNSGGFFGKTLAGLKWGRKKEGSTRSVAQDIFSNWGPAKTSPGTVTDPLETNIVVHRAVTIVAQTLASVPICVYRGEEKVERGPLNKLLDHPNALMTGDRFVSSIATMALIDGQSFAILGERDSRGLPADMIPANSNTISPIRESTYDLRGWQYGQEALAVDQVLRFEYSPDPDDPLSAIPPLAAAADDLESDLASSEYNKQALNNGAPIAGLLKWKSPDVRLSEDDLDRAQRRFNDKYQGTQNAEGVAVLTGDWDFQNVASTSRDMQYLEGRNFIQQRLGMIYGIPPVLLGDYSNTGLSSAGLTLARRVLYENSVIPLARHIQAVLTRAFTNFEDEFKIVFDFEGIEALREDYTEKLTQAKELGALGYPLNVVNEQMGLGMPSMTWGDESLVNSSLTTATSVIDASDLGDFDDMPTTAPETTDTTEDPTIVEPTLDGTDPAIVEGGPAKEFTGVQMTTAVDIVGKVALGELAYDSAVGLLKTLFGFSTAEAEEMLGPRDAVPEVPLSASVGRAISVPVFIRNNAARGLKYNAEGKGGDGLTDKTLREARQLARGTVSDDKVRRMRAWFDRHLVDLDAAKNSDPNDDDYPGPGAVAWLLWGGNPTSDPMQAREWCDKQIQKLEEGDGASTERSNRSSARR